MSLKAALMAGAMLVLGTGAQAQGVNPQHVQCIAHIVWTEARGEPIEGQYKVAMHCTCWGFTPWACAVAC